MVQTRYRVLYGDVDAMDVVYYGNYLRFFERGRAEFMRDLGMTYKQVEEQGFILPVTEAHCHYHLSARYDDLILIETRIGQVKRASMRFEYQIFQDEDGRKPLAEGYTLHACLNPEGRIVRLPGFLYDLFEKAGGKT
ncbi:MAG: acyl-CoA thioesterase [Proteobacteria bacterium]|nr:acyl-CoA thioesterase [Pseudomonadota bacterium]